MINLEANTPRVGSMGRRTRRRDPELERFWRRAVAERERSGLSVRAFCSGRRLAEANFYAWRRELKQRDASASSSAPTASVSAALKFVPLQVRAGGYLEVVLPAGVIVRVPIGAEATSVAALVAALRAASC